MGHGMNKVLFVVGLLIFPSLCFAVDYYAEYSFDDKEIDIRVTDYFGWNYNFISRYTKAQIQERIDKDKIAYAQTHRRWKLADYMSRMLRASTDKRIFFINLSVEQGPYGFLFIKINENEYIEFFTGS
ncbi:hypothetical protein FACS1894130_12500 [Spirochaetia bacterium]|nr:hypothetical protein FACS1894130_12500 [Spirochaetia bacterium]